MIKKDNATSNFLLSIVIPTRNRYKYLIEFINVFIGYFSKEIELVIQDNSDTNSNLLNEIDFSQYENIHYIYDNSKRYSQTENSELAIKNSHGEYICYIGDDDIVSTKIVDLCHWLKENNIDSCYGPIAHYYWDDVKFKFIKYPFLKIPCPKSGFIKTDSLEELKYVVRKGCITLGRMPRVYQGIIKKTILENVFDKFGSYFPGSSPDMANATACSMIEQKSIYINFPIIVSGSGYNSASGKGLRGKHIDDIKNVDQLPKDVLESWNDKIPKIWVSNSIWAQSCWESLKKYDPFKLINQINYNYLYANMIVFYPETKKYVKQCNGINIISSFYIFCIFIFRILNFAINFIRTKFKFNLNSYCYYDPIKLEHALKILDDKINIEYLLKENNK